MLHPDTYTSSHSRYTREATIADSSHHTLLRAMGRWDLTAIGVNQVIGSGIFVIPATAAALVGAAPSLSVWIVASLVNFLIVLCFAEAGSRFGEAGGPYLYASTAFGPFAGFQVAWMMWLTRVASQAALVNAFALYLARFWPGASMGWGRVFVITGLLALLMGVNLRGIRYGSWTVNLFTWGKSIPLVAFIILGMFYIDWNRFEGLLEPRWDGFGEATLLLMFTFGGYELVTLPAGEAVTPRQDVPSALIKTIVLVCIVYILIQLVAVGTLPNLAASKTPLADAAARFLGPVAGVAIAIGGLVSIGGSNAGSMLAGPRLTYAMGLRGQLPGLFIHVHRRYRSPDSSILIYSAAALMLALSGTFEKLAAVSAVARLVFYAATCAAVPVLRRHSSERRGAFELRGGPAIPISALMGSLAIIAGADRFSLMAGGIALAVGSGLYFVQKASFERDR